MDNASEPESTRPRPQQTRALRHQRCRLAFMVVLALVLVAASLGRAANAQAQATNTFGTTTSVPGGGTMTATVTTPGVTITSSTPVTGCPTTGFGTPTVTYTCAAGSGGISAGTSIVQTYSGATGPVAGTVTYNANGPITGFPAVANYTIDTGNCTAPSGSSSTCGLQTSAVTVPTGTFVLAVTAAAGQTAQVTSGPATVGTCPISAAFPTEVSAVAGFVLVPYTCSSTQSIPSGTTVSGVVVATGGALPPKMTASSNDNAPIAAMSSVPAPTTQTLNAGAGAPTGVNPGQGTAVALSAGWNLIGGPAGTVVKGNVGPLYTYQAGDTSYETIANGTPLRAGFGYWASFNASTTMTLPAVSAQTQTITLPPGQWIMVGNPGNTPATVSGADIVYTYNPVSNYQAATSLNPGQGAWAISTNGGTLTITNR